MGFPPDLHLVTVTGTILRPADGSPAKGIVLFEMPYPLTDTAGHVLVGNQPIVAPLVDGTFTVALPATDQTAVRPLNWTYKITVSTDAVYDQFQAALPTTPHSTTLDQLTPVETPPSVGVWVPVTALGATVATLGTDHKVPADQLPAGSGGGVNTVTAADSTIAVTGTATNPVLAVGAIPTSKVPTLDTQLAAKADLVGGKVPQAQIPAVALVDYLGAVASQAAMLALTGQRGDWCTRTDLGDDWQLIADDPTQLANWREHVYPASPVQSVAGRTGAVTLAKTDVGLGNVDNTADTNKPVSTAQQTALNGKVNLATATTKGDLLVATGAGTLVRLGVGSDTQILTADSAQAAGVKWAAAPAGGGASGQDNVFPLSGYGLVAASGNPGEFQNQSGVSANTVFMARVWIPANTAISKLCAAVRTGGTYATSSTPNQIAIYDDTGAQIGITTDDNTLWATAGWAVRTITTIAAQGTGRFVYIGYIVGGYSGLSMPFPMGANDANAPWLGQNINNAGNRRAFYLVASSLPASFNPASVGTSTGYIPLVGAA